MREPMQGCLFNTHCPKCRSTDTEIINTDIDSKLVSMKCNACGLHNFNGYEPF